MSAGNLQDTQPGLFSSIFGRLGLAQEKTVPVAAFNDLERRDSVERFEDQWARYNSSKKAVPGTVKQVRGATYPPITTTPRSKIRAASTSNAITNITASKTTSNGTTDENKRLSASSESSSFSSRRTSGQADRRKSMGNVITTPTSNNKQEKSIPRVQSHEELFNRKFDILISQNTLDVKQLKKLGWNGLPKEHRGDVWKLLLGYLPANKGRREKTLERKRQEYRNMVERNFESNNARSDGEEKSFRQIHIDVKRTHPDIKLFQDPTMRRLLERVLYCWALRHPASGYVQGINDLVTPFLIVFLEPHCECPAIELTTLTGIDKQILNDVEADAFWCLTRFIDGIQDHYTVGQPGIQKLTILLEDICRRIDEPLHAHFGEFDLKYLQFAFRWMNCLLMREMPLQLIIRLWDTYMAEGENFPKLHVYVCAALLNKWSKEIQEKDFQDTMIFLQHLPTEKWSDDDVQLLISTGYMWMQMFTNAPSHFRTDSTQ
mmetsp:Transcript_8274/g.9204  ORF Transcript_8274/g.9204 Transcript_8274/m.9204 type:complete len:490 (+) Transcript_8274:53-1522(+)